MSLSKSLKDKDVKFRRPVQNEEDFEAVIQEVAGDLYQSVPGNARVVSSPPLLSETTRCNIRQMRNSFDQQFGPQILQMANECRAAMTAGHMQVLRFFSEITKDVLADGYSWSAIFFLIFLVLSIIGVVGLGILSSRVIPLIWRHVRRFITAQ